MTGPASGDLAAALRRVPRLGLTRTSLDEGPVLGAESPRARTADPVREPDVPASPGHDPRHAGVAVVATVPGATAEEHSEPPDISTRVEIATDVPLRSLAATATCPTGLQAFSRPVEPVIGKNVPAAEGPVLRA